MLDEVEQAKRYLTDPEYSSEPELAKIATEGEASIAVIPWAYSGLLAIEAAEASEGPCDELVVAKLRERLEPISDRGYKKYQEIIDAVAPLALMAESSPSLLPGLDGNFDNATPDLYPVPRDVIELGCDPVREASASQGQNLAFAC